MVRSNEAIDGSTSRLPPQLLVLLLVVSEVLCTTANGSSNSSSTGSRASLVVPHRHIFEFTRNVTVKFVQRLLQVVTGTGRSRQQSVLQVELCPSSPSRGPLPQQPAVSTIDWGYMTGTILKHTVSWRP